VLDHVEKVVLVLGGLGGLLSSTLLDDELVESQLLGRSLQDSLLDGVLFKRKRKTLINVRPLGEGGKNRSHLGDEPEDVDLLRLSDSMSTIHRLQIGLRVPANARKRETTRWSDRRRPADEDRDKNR
jgi:hypothetical protein